MVEAEKFAWWGVPDPAAAAAAAGLPTGERATLLVALPDSAAGLVRAAEVPAALVETGPAVAALSTQDLPDGASPSLRAWSRLASAVHAARDLDELVHELPTAGHAAVCLDGTSIWSARATVDAARRATVVAATPGKGVLRGVLRPYQRAGVAWLETAARGGGVLADEMGLGKTVQAIALLAGRQQRPHLVVCPTTVLGTWARELARFAPDLDVIVHAGPDRPASPEPAEPGTVVLTSYGILRSDTGLSEVDWDVVVLDEAQQIKNPDTGAARAARSLPAQLRVAMTGTPVENRLDELWSLLAFTNPGVLGSRSRFRRRFAVAVEQQRSAAAADRLHELVEPYILRRRKSDVAPELPAKIEVTVVCTMTDEQERRYRAAMDEAFSSGLGIGIGRRGRVLSLLTRLKMICNHPEQAEPTGAPLGGRSGKLDRATEMLAEIVDAGDRALVFTQYRRTGELLAQHLKAEVTGGAVPFLHGGLAMPAREKMISRFSDDPDGPPILVLSLRAAGFGLTLTRATHVLHFDRWWNPAVEDQASDRAHRIGQNRTVTVHTLLTERTLEVTIADLHAGKRAVAGVATGQGLTSDADVAQLSDEALRAVLDPGARR